MDFLQQYIGI